MAQNDNDKKLDPSQIDQDAGDMNNGTLGGDLGVDVSSNDEDEKNYSRVSHPGGTDTVRGDTGGGADNGSKSGSRLGTDGSSSNAGGQAEGSAAENI